MVDLLQVLEGATYLAFIVGAIVAVSELRSIRRDRELDFYLRVNDRWSTGEFEEAFTKIRELPPDLEDPREIEKRCGSVALYTFVDYLDGIAQLARNNMLDKDVVGDLAEWQGLWIALEPWILEKRQRRSIFASDFQWIVEDEVRWFNQNDPGD